MYSLSLFAESLPGDLQEHIFRALPQAAAESAGQPGEKYPPAPHNSLRAPAPPPLQPLSRSPANRGEHWNQLQSCTDL